jgi:hypothetical protein
MRHNLLRGSYFCIICWPWQLNWIWFSIPDRIWVRQCRWYILSIICCISPKWILLFWIHSTAKTYICSSKAPLNQEIESPQTLMSLLQIFDRFFYTDCSPSKAIYLHSVAKRTLYIKGIIRRMLPSANFLFDWF